MKKRVADIIVEELIRNDIVDCFAVVGGGAMYLDNALAIHGGMYKYFNHHEQACAMAAEAYARVSGKMACVCVTSGPGALNTLNGVAGAWEDSIPMIVLSGQVRIGTSVEEARMPLRCRGIQEFEIIDSVRNMTKYAVKIKNPLCIRREIGKAVQIAMSGRRGPVWLDIPLDIQAAIVEERELESAETYIEAYKINIGQMQVMKSALLQARRPCILAGSAIISSGSREKFLEFISKVRVPIVGGALLADLLPVSYERYYGLSGNIGPRVGNFILQNADVILVLGNSLSFRQTGFNQDAFAQSAEIIMVDCDENEAKKPGLKVRQLIHATLAEFFIHMQKDGFEMDCAKEWINYCDKLKVRFPDYEGKERQNLSEGVGMYNFWEEYDRMSPDSIVTALGNSTVDSAKLQSGVRGLGQRVVANYTIGSMGYDLPAAIGAAVASGKEVVCVTGDGSIMMNLQEMQTIRHYNLPIKIVLFSNDGYNAIRQTYNNYFDGVYIGCTADTGVSFPDFQKVALTFGFGYRCCRSNLELRECIGWLFASKGNVLLEVEQKFDDQVVPKVMPKKSNDGTSSVSVLHDMYPFLTERDMEEFMMKDK